MYLGSGLLIGLGRDSVLESSFLPGRLKIARALNRPSRLQQATRERGKDDHRGDFWIPSWM